MSGGTYRDVDALRAALLGRSVREVRRCPNDFEQVYEGEVVLDDGTVLRLVGNDGCAGCTAGHYFLTALNEMPINAIMDVEVDVAESTRGRDVYRIFVLAQDERISLAEFTGWDNGWYGTGFRFEVHRPEE